MPQRRACSLHALERLHLVLAQSQVVEGLHGELLLGLVHVLLEQLGEPVAVPLAREHLAVGVLLQRHHEVLQRQRAQLGLQEVLEVGPVLALRWWLQYALRAFPTALCILRQSCMIGLSYQ